MTTHYIATTPVTYKDDRGTEKTSFRRIGVMFQNTRRDTGEIFYSLKLDFPVGVTDIVLFPPKDRNDIEE